MNGWFGKSDPFYVISRLREGLCIPQSSFACQSRCRLRYTNLSLWCPDFISLLSTRWILCHRLQIGGREGHAGAQLESSQGICAAAVQRRLKQVAAFFKLLQQFLDARLKQTPAH
jgi:hypothetical protein